MKYIFTFVLLFIVSLNLFGSEPEVVKNRLDLENEMRIQQPAKQIITPDKITPLILSTFVPGSGQVYFGHELKGTLFAVGFFSTAITAILSHNNMVARDDQIKVFVKEYKGAQEFAEASKIWRNIEEAREKRDADFTRRNIFMGAAAGVWLANIIDMLFFTEDKGVDEFSMSSSNIDLRMSDIGPNIEIKFFLP